ncbi:MAG: hypothetical protein LC667_05670 [Thioalkalivibrio sp.]|nr:hypothetical protein [Thioalkalivibrio sp.]
MLEALTHLEYLGIGGTAIKDVSFLDGYTNLHSLWAWSLDLDDVSPITSLTTLRTLDVGDLGIADLSFLAPFTDLVSLSAWGNGITDISVLQDKDLEWVNIGGNLLTDLAPLVANTALAAGAFVDVTYNCLDLTPGSAAMTEIEELLDRGVNVIYEPQFDGCV